MIRLVYVLCAWVGIACIAASCSDNVEPNQLAFVVGTAIDHTADGDIEVSHQIKVTNQQGGPGKGGSSEGSGSQGGFIVLSGRGKDVFEAQQKIQREMSRRLMLNHRVLIAISEDYFNKDEVRKLFDKLGRDPSNNLRDVILLVKGGSAKDFLLRKYPFEGLSSIGVAKKLQINGVRNFSSRQLIIDTLSEGTSSMLPVVQLNAPAPNGSKSEAVRSEYAVLDKNLKVKGILNDLEGSRAGWISGSETVQGLTLPWKDGKGSLSFRLTQLRRQIRAESGGNPSKHIEIIVKANAYLLENTTPLNMSEAKNLAVVQTYLNERFQQELQLTMDKVQSWGSDIFGIGEYLHQSSPYWWKSQRADWNRNFKNLHVTVLATIRLKSIGMIGKL